MHRSPWPSSLVAARRRKQSKCKSSGRTSHGSWSASGSEGFSLWGTDETETSEPLLYDFVEFCCTQKAVCHRGLTQNVRNPSQDFLLDHFSLAMPWHGYEARVIQYAAMQRCTVLIALCCRKAKEMVGIATRSKDATRGSCPYY